MIAWRTIADFIAQDSPRRAVSFVRELAERCERLAETPHGFQLVPGYEHSGIRRRPYGEYLIFYRVHAARIEVLHILAGARDYGAMLFPET